MWNTANLGGPVAKNALVSMAPIQLRVWQVSLAMSEILQFCNTSTGDFHPKHASLFTHTGFGEPYD